MILYIVQIELESQIESDWLSWMRREHCPQVVATGCFQSWRMYRVVEPPAPVGRSTWAIHYTAADRQDMDRYLRDFAPALRKHVVDRYGGRFTAARRILEEA